MKKAGKDEKENDGDGWIMWVYEDSKGNLLTADEIYELNPWEIEKRGIHVFAGV